MNRIIKINDYLGIKKYVLVKEIGIVGIYQEKTPSGYFVSQSYLLKRDDENRLFVFESYNNMLWEEMLDYADLLNDEKSFGLKAFMKNSVYTIHPNGTLKI